MENTNCPVCGNNKSILLGIPLLNALSKKIAKTDYKVVQCTNCDLYFVSPKLNFSKEEWQALYNSHYFVENTKWLENKRKIDLHTRLDRLNSYIYPKNEINFLDIGCGQGYGLIQSLARGWNTTGLDIRDNRVEAAKIIDINFNLSDLTNTELKDNSFDIIYLDSVLEHVLNPLEYLEKIKNLLKSGGVAYIGVPNEDSFLNDIRKLASLLGANKKKSAKLKPLDSPYHIIGFNRTSLKYIINKSGLNQLYFRNFSRKMEFLSFRLYDKEFWIGILLVPIEIGGMILRKDIYFEVILQKQN
jgi:2-polyprenyl-3-methyl-5-hydroxy-6-metoxy-1,4-benzoquinol methylase